MKSRLRCLIENCYIILVRCFKKGILITFGKLYYKHSSATWIKCLRHLHYCYWQVTSRGPKICWTWTKTDMPVDQKGYYTCWLWTNGDTTYSLVTGRVLTVDENGYLRIKCPRNHKTSRKLASGMECGLVFLWSVLNIFTCVNSNLQPN